MRASGILMHISSLPSPHGIGTLGKESYAFADFLKAAGQKYWQVLPIGPTGFGDSPYQSASAFAGNPYFIDLDALAEDGLLTAEEIAAVNWGADPLRVDYGALYNGRGGLLREAYRRGWQRDREAVAAFEAENADWLADYALFTAAKTHFNSLPWTQWEDEDLRLRRSGEALERWRGELREDVECCVYTQYLFFRQWNALREYVHSLGISIIGDVPIYVPHDSADVWADRDNYQLDDRGYPTEVAGVPPDYFTEDGQLWGNPLYDWEKMASEGYAWWLRRLGAAGRIFDVVRIDHFRGLESYWSVPFGEKTARNGRWRPGPAQAFVDAVKNGLPKLRIIAEDLGYLTPEVIALRKNSGWPGMKIMQFAFDGTGENDSLPHMLDRNTVYYFGTHDNMTLGEWLEQTDEKSLAHAREYLGLNFREGPADGLLRGGLGSVADLFVTQMQDWLGLAENCRMNEPGTADGNWCWRMEKGADSPALAARICRMTERYGR